MPARLIRYRFDEEVRDKLKRLDYSKFDKNYIETHIELLESKMTIASVDNLLAEDN